MTIFKMQLNLSGHLLSTDFPAKLFSVLHLGDWQYKSLIHTSRGQMNKAYEKEWKKSKFRKIIVYVLYSKIHMENEPGSKFRISSYILYALEWYKRTKHKCYLSVGRFFYFYLFRHYFCVHACVCVLVFI